MVDHLPSTMLACPTCGGKEITFRESRHVHVYFRQKIGPPPAKDPFHNVLKQDESGSLYEVRSETTYHEDVQAFCHSCGLKWVIPNCKNVGAIKYSNEPMNQTTQSPQPRPPQKRKIKGGEVVIDIEAGLSDHYLMRKYEVSSRQLEFLLQRLLDKGLVSQRQLDDRVNLADTTVTRAFMDTQKSLEELHEDQPDKKATRSFRVFPHPDQTASQKVSAPRRTVRAQDFIRDLDIGVGDSDLMLKYGLSPQQLELFFKKLLDAGLITVEQLYGRTSISGTSITKAFVEVYQSLQELD
jgi:hypothetical protein